MPILTEDDKRVIWQIFTFVDDILKHDAKYKQFIAIAEATLDQAKRDAVDYHLEHLATLNINAASVDAYKVASWYGFYVAKHADDVGRVAVLAAIKAMSRFLRNESSIALDRDTQRMLYFLARNDGARDEFAIGKNGLYMAFSTARAVLKAAGKISLDSIVPVVRVFGGFAS